MSLLDNLRSDFFSEEWKTLLVGQVIFNTPEYSLDGMKVWKKVIKTAFKPLPKETPEETRKYEISLPEYLKGNISSYCWENYNLFTKSSHTISSIEYVICDSLPFQNYFQKRCHQIRDILLQKTDSFEELANKIYELVRNVISAKDRKLYLFYEEQWEEMRKHRLQEILECVKPYLNNDNHDFFKLTKNRDKLFHELYFLTTGESGGYCSNRFDDSHWESNHYYTGFKNGTVICRDDKVFFRITLPEDYILYKMDASYGNVSEEKVKELEDYLKKLFPDEETLHYMKKLLASLLVNDESRRSNYFLYGPWNNSKTGFLRVLRGCLGELSYDLPRTILKTPSNRSWIVSYKHRRFCIISEPEGELSHRSFQELSGRVIMIDVNQMPTFDSFRPEYERFIKIIPFTTKWDDQAPEDPLEQEKHRHYKADVHFYENSDWSNELLQLMVDYYPSFYHEDLVDTPKLIEEATESFWRNSNYYRIWAEQSFVHSPNSESSVNESYRGFIDFYKEQYPEKIVPDRATYRYYMTVLLGKPINGSWKDVRYTTQ
jgi:hypothetical protein